MQNFVCLLCLTLLSLTLCAQQKENNTGNVIPPTPLHLVSGIVLDSGGNVIAGATVKLTSPKDSIVIQTDIEGIFNFEKIKSASFTLTISAIRYKTQVKRYLNNEFTSNITLDPIIINESAYQLDEVKVEGRPPIVYKTDTVEYKASDYKTPPFANIADLLKQVDGMEVGRDGSLIYQGQEVIKGKLNGKSFAGGDVRQMLQNLPADIVEKIQILDDYGEQAAKTGVKAGQAEKQLNITTKSNKSIGNLANLKTQLGNNKRFSEQLSLQQINGNKVLSLTGGVKRIVNGIASQETQSEGGLSNAGIPGTTLSSSPAFSYANHLGKSSYVVASYLFNHNNTQYLNNRYGQLNSSLGPSYFTDQNEGQNKQTSHNAAFKIDLDISKSDFLQFNTGYQNNRMLQAGESLSDRINYFSTGFEHLIVNLNQIAMEQMESYDMSGLYVHVFHKPERNFSLQMQLSNSNNTKTNDQLVKYRYYADSETTTLLSDSTSHLSVLRSGNRKVIRSKLTFIEPLADKWKLELTGQLRISDYTNNAKSDTILTDGSIIASGDLLNSFWYTFFELRGTGSLRYNEKKNDLTLGLSAVPTRLNSMPLSRNRDNRQTDFKVLPVFRFSHAWSQLAKFQITYDALIEEPESQQLQPFVDRSDPNNIVIGNPNLKPTYTHTLTASFHRYFPNQMFNMSFSTDGKFFADQITTNISQITIPISKSANKTLNEINYINLSGSKVIIGRYALSKHMFGRKINLELNGSLKYQLANASSNDLLYHTDSWIFDNRFGPRLKFGQGIAVNPYICYNLNRSFTSTLNATPIVVKRVRLAIEGYIDLHKWQFNYDASKFYVSGLSTYTQNPFIINAGVERRLLKRNNLMVTLNIYDLLHQNNLVQQTITPQASTFLVSNTQSRYFLIGLRLNLQKWGGTPSKDGQPLKRRGDGGFIQ